MGVDELLRLLGEQETMRRAEVGRLEAEQERLAGLLAACRVGLERAAAAREIVGLVPAPPVAGFRPWRAPRSGSSCSTSWPRMRVRRGPGGGTALGEDRGWPGTANGSGTG